MVARDPLALMVDFDRAIGIEGEGSAHKGIAEVRRHEQENSERNTAQLHRPG